jgi:hypothetical protein
VFNVQLFNATIIYPHTGNGLILHSDIGSTERCQTNNNKYYDYSSLFDPIIFYKNFCLPFLYRLLRLNITVCTLLYSPLPPPLPVLGRMGLARQDLQTLPTYGLNQNFASSLPIYSSTLPTPPPHTTNITCLKQESKRSWLNDLP